jgi:hypothetical protein
VRAVPAWPLGGSAHLSFQAAASQSGQRGQPGSRARAKPGRCQRSGGEGRSPPLSCVGMCSQTAVRRRRTEAATIEAATTSVYPGQSDVVGLAGLEPAASSLSGIEGSALCGAAFSQVTAERQARSYAFLATSSQAVQASQTGQHTLVRGTPAYLCRPLRRPGVLMAGGQALPEGRGLGPAGTPEDVATAQRRPKLLQWAIRR